jgi:exonuclease SbcC
MKILSVEMSGFGPFKDAQAVNFSAFDDSGIFLIGGRTGSGKSTILDAICFALYNSVPRYDGYSGVVRLRSDHCETDDVTQVTLTFEANDEIYRIVRNPEHDRPKSRGPGMRRQAASVELSMQTCGGGWEVIETKIPEVARRVTEIVKLDKGQFLQVILLAQNRFQEFLEADSKDRQGLLRTLFGTQRFEDYAEGLHARAQELGGELMRLTAGAARTVEALASELEVEPPAEAEDRLAWANVRMSAAEQALTDSRAAEARAQAEAQAASAALAAAEQLADRQQRRRRAQDRLAELEARAEGHIRAEQRYEAAVRASLIKAPLADVDANASILKKAREQELGARGMAGAVPESGLGEFLTGIVQTLGSLAQALETEATLTALQRAHADATSAMADHDASCASISSRRASLRQRLRELSDLEGRAALISEDLFAADALIASTKTAYAAALRLAEMQIQIDQLKESEFKASLARTAASREVDRLLGLQRLGRAASLAQNLLDGEPCQVCGALEHPVLAEFDGELVTDGQVAHARRLFEQANSAANAASSVRGDTEALAAEQRGVAGNRSVEELHIQLERARARLSAAQAANEQIAMVVKERELIVATQERLDEEERTGADRRTRLAQSAIMARKTLTDAQNLIDAARAGYPSVATRAGVLKAQQTAVERLISAHDEAVRADAAHRASLAKLTTQLAECRFADRGAAENAMLPGDTLEALAKAIRVYQDELTQSRAVLDQPDLQNLPEDPANVADAHARTWEADAVRIADTEWRVTLESRTKRGHELTAKLRTELQQSIEIDAEFRIVDLLSDATRGEPPNQLGIPLESFVLAAELEEIVAAANLRLQSMSQGRYAIEHSDERTRGGKRTGLEIRVYDAHTGALRSPLSLSGGEKFLASLALALGLAEVVTNRAGGIQLDTLFIDEGFGALDNETLELAMHTLDELRHGGRTVGVISHVEAMKDQIPAKLLVDVTDGGWSVIHQSELLGVS